MSRQEHCNIRLSRVILINKWHRHLSMFSICYKIFERNVVNIIMWTEMVLLSLIYFYWYTYIICLLTRIVLFSKRQKVWECNQIMDKCTDCSERIHTNDKFPVSIIDMFSTCWWHIHLFDTFLSYCIHLMIYITVVLD